MMRSLYSGVSGLKNHQTRMDVVGNNISNVNTTGFKSSRVTFSDTLSQTLSGASAPTENIGGTNPKQIGLGSAVNSIDTLFTDGSVQSTGKNTDLCLSGNGLFYVKQGNEEYYTRNGNFEFDASGNLVLSGSGLYVQGYQGNNGKLSDKITNIKVEVGKSIPPIATQNITYSKNLNSAEPTIVEINGGTVDQVTKYTYTQATDGSVSPTPAKPAKITLDSGDVLEATTGGPYTVGDTLKYTKNTAGDSFTPTATNPTKVGIKNCTAIDGAIGTAYTVGGTINHTYNTAGDTATVTVDTTAKATLKNGQTYTGVRGDTIKVGGTCTYSAQEATVDANSTITINGNPVTGGAGTKYCTKATYDANPTAYATYKYQDDTGADITDLKITSEVVSMDVTSKVEKLDIEAKITQLEVMTKRYIADENHPVTIKMSDGSTITRNSNTYAIGESLPLTTTVTAYDSLGNAHAIPIYLTKTYTGTGEPIIDPDTGKPTGRTDGNKWTISLSPDPTGKTVQITELDGSTTTVTMDNPITIHFDGAGGNPILDEAGVKNQSTLLLTNGANTGQNLTIDFSTITQYAGSNTVNGGSDGQAAGTLKSVSIDSSGVITGVYTNGVKQSEGQIVVAQFNNAAGLTKSGNGLYEASNNSGTKDDGGLKIGAIGAEVSGVTITPSALEMSNVDMASELTDMIVTQRGYQSNSKIITVSDELLETLINMKR